MAIDFNNKNNIEQFIIDNIVEINSRITNFKKKYMEPEGVAFDDVDIKRYLKKKLYDEYETIVENIINRFNELGCKKSKIPIIASEFVLYKKDVQALLEADVFKKLKEADYEELKNVITEAILDGSGISDAEKKFLRTSLKKITGKSLYLLLQNGFQVNLNNIESGVMTANGGDAAQFLFIARAISAGFNCSNVDVRSSRYDAVIDYKGHLFKVQVKGISTDEISFKDRDRGGRGIDTHNERNIGKRITAKDCDLFVAVDKQVGLCYLIPMKDIDPWADDEIENVNVNRLGEYLENWGMIDRMFQELP